MKVTAVEFQLAQCGNPQAKAKVLRSPAKNLSEVASRLGVSMATVTQWRVKFNKLGIKQPTFPKGRKREVKSDDIEALNRIAESVSQ